MTKHGQLVRLGEGAPDPSEESGLAELLDPVALEARLREARARRAEALYRRQSGTPDDDAAPTVAAPLPLVADPPRTAQPPAGPAPSQGGSRRATRRLVPAVIFALGLALGGAVVAFLAQPEVRRGIALVIAPEIAPAPDSAPPPVDWTPPAPSPAPAPPRAVDTGPADPPAAPPRADAAPDRPETAPGTAADTPPPDPAPVATPIPVETSVAPEPAPTPAALPPRVIIHYPASAEAAATAARDALRAAGAPQVDVVPVRFAIGATNIRYYHDPDRDGAGRVAEIVAPSLDGAPATRDFTDYAPSPLPGIVEMWLAGTAPAAPRRAVPAPVLAEPTMPEGTQAEAVARIIVQRSLERLLESVPPR